MGFTDSLLGADTSDLIQMNLWVKNDWFHLQETFCLCRAKASLQSPAWLLARAYPQEDKHLGCVDFEPT